MWDEWGFYGDKDVEVGLCWNELANQDLNQDKILIIEKGLFLMFLTNNLVQSM